MTPGQLIRQKRKEQKLTVKELASKSGVPARTVLALERGENFGRVGTLKKIFNALGFEFEFVITPLDNCNKRSKVKAG